MKRYSKSLFLLESLLKENYKNELVFNRLCVSNYHLGNEEKAKFYGQKLLVLKDKKALSKSNNRVVSTSPIKTTANKIIAYSLWGNERAYLQGAIVNAILCSQIYAGWKCRFYLDSSVPENVRKELIRLGAEIVDCEKKDRDIPNYFWRFLIATDSHVDQFLCRDTDSRLSLEEYKIVCDWEQSDKPFHIIRDHLIHTDLILAGLWGGRRIIDFDLRSEIISFLKHDTVHYGSDQRFLGQVIWPLIRNNVLIHDNNYNLFGSKKIPLRQSSETHIGIGYTGQKYLNEEIERYGLLNFFN